MLDAAFVRRIMRISTTDGLFATQYTVLTTGALLTTFLLALGASEFQIGLVAAFPLLGGLLQPGGAELIRRRGGWRKPVCLTGVLLDALLWGVSLSAVLLLRPEAALVVVIGVLALQQAAAAVNGVAWTSWISDLIPASFRGRYFGRRNFLCNAAGAFTLVGAGQLVRLAGPDTVPVFVGLITAAVALRFVSLYVLSRQPEPFPAESPSGGFARQLAQPLAHPGFRQFLFYGIAWGFAVQLAAPFFTVYMIRDAAVGADLVMLYAGLGTAANLVGQRVWGPLCDRYGDLQVMKRTGLIVLLQPLWWLFTAGSGPGYYLMAVLSVTGGFAWGGHLLATGNLMMRLAPETGKTAFFAMQAALGGLFGALGPFVGGLLATALSAHGSPLPGWWFEGLKTLFLLSFVLRFLAWLLLHRVPEPVRRPRLRAVYLLRDTVRTFNPTQGFSPLLHVFTSMPARRRDTPPRSSRKDASARR